jgi:hypothetical protein
MTRTIGEGKEGDQWTNIVDSEPTSNTNISSMGDTNYRWLGHHAWLPGSVFLHIGLDDLEGLDENSPSLPPLPLLNPLIPRMITVMGTHRFPVLSIFRLFSHPGSYAKTSEAAADAEMAQKHKDLDRLKGLISQSKLLQNPDGRGASSADADAGNYLLFVRSLQGPESILIDEVWRLWQYLGGANMDVSFFDVVEDTPPPEEAPSRGGRTRTGNRAVGAEDPRPTLGPNVRTRGTASGGQQTGRLPIRKASSKLSIQKHHSTKAAPF